MLSASTSTLATFSSLAAAVSRPGWWSWCSLFPCLQLKWRPQDLDSLAPRDACSCPSFSWDRPSQPRMRPQCRQGLSRNFWSASTLDQREQPPSCRCEHWSSPCLGTWNQGRRYPGRSSNTTIRSDVILAAHSLSRPEKPEPNGLPLNYCGHHGRKPRAEQGTGGFLGDKEPMSISPAGKGAVTRDKSLGCHK